ncbi:hypothetical protein CHU98_g11191 [Xylaria longipes]|nr:hypothetical protein CHU98_g11191 [Xylaria longipes]
MYRHKADRAWASLIRSEAPGTPSGARLSVKARFVQGTGSMLYNRARPERDLQRTRICGTGRIGESKEIPEYLGPNEALDSGGQLVFVVNEAVVHGREWGGTYTKLPSR